MQTQILVNGKIIEARLTEYDHYNNVRLICKYNLDVAHLHINNIVNLLFVFNNDQIIEEKAKVSFVRLDDHKIIQLGFRLLDNNSNLKLLAGRIDNESNI